MVNLRYDLNLIFHALADPTRRAVLKQISAGEKRITELQPVVTMSLAAVSKHVKVLEKSGLIIKRRQGREIVVSLNQAAMLSADEWISRYTELWNQQLDSLDTYLKNKKRH